VGRQTLYFFPDRLLIYDTGRIGAVGYDQIRVKVEQTRFIEDGVPPRDAHVVDHTWRYVNKNGTPDKRFANNARLPICLYDEIRFASYSGLNEVIQVSKYGVGISLAETVLSFGKITRSHGHNGKAPVNEERPGQSTRETDCHAGTAPGGTENRNPSTPAEFPLNEKSQPPRFDASPPVVPSSQAPPAFPDFCEPIIPPVPLVGPPPRVPSDVTHHAHKGNKLQWAPPGAPVQIAGRTIHGMIYTADMARGWGNEPSAISRADTVDSDASVQEELPYYPNYSALTPSQRAFYLDWLARGRRDDQPDALPTGYLFLFFYGIERRMLVERDYDSSLWYEVYELLRLYGLTRNSRSLVSYFSDFLHFTSYSQGAAEYAIVCQTLLELQERRISELALTLTLANHHRMGQPLGWAIAHLVAKNLEDSRRSVVIERTGEAFKGMFRKRFEDLYPEGLSLQAAKRDQTVQYETGNSSINPRLCGYLSGNSRPEAAVTLKVPGVMGIKSQFKNLSVIWNQCIEDLSGYSRAISRLSSSASVSNQDRLKAHLALPAEIRKNHLHPLSDPFETAFQACPEIDDIRFMPVAVLAGLLGFEERASLTQGQSEELAALIESLAHTIAPHPVILNLPLAWNQEVAITACPAVSSAPKELGGLLRLLYLAVLVASADGTIDESEMEVFHRTIRIGDEYSRIQIRATEAALTRDTHAVSKHLPRIAKSMHQEERMSVFKLLVHIACSDELLSSDENRLLRRIGKAFQLADNTLDDILADDSSFQTVTVSRGKARSGGEAIPQPAQLAAPAFSLNMDRIAALTAETEEVVSILSKALAEESHEDASHVTVQVPEAPQSVIPAWMASLEARYQPALLEIIVLPDGHAIDLAAIAGNHHLIADDLIDGINAWSDEALGDFLIEVTDDGLSTIQRELLPN